MGHTVPDPHDKGKELSPNDAVATSAHTSDKGSYPTPLQHDFPEGIISRKQHC